MNIEWQDAVNGYKKPTTVLNKSNGIFKSQKLFSLSLDMNEIDTIKNKLRK